MLDLTDKTNAYVCTLYRRMRRRLLVVKAMVHSPPILVLDEPSAQVDLNLCRKLWGNVIKMNMVDIIILLTTHYLEEAEGIFDTIAIINQAEKSLV